MKGGWREATVRLVRTAASQRFFAVLVLLLVLVVVPEIWAQHLGPLNPTVLPGDYGRRLLLTLAVIAVLTTAGAAALGLADTVGDLSEGKQFDAILLRPPAGTALDIGLRHADSPEGALGKIFALAGDADVAEVWVGGDQVASGGFVRPVSHLAPAGRRTPAG